MIRPHLPAKITPCSLTFRKNKFKMKLRKKVIFIFAVLEAIIYLSEKKEEK